MIVAECMVREVATVRPEMSLEDLCEIFQLRHIHGAPVVDENGKLLGIVTQEDVVYGAMGLGSPSKENRDIPSHIRGAATPTPPENRARAVADIMTSPAIHVDEDADVAEACKLMWALRIHRLPVVRDGKVTGIISSMAIGGGRLG
jgi:CBS domain-containing protein